MHDVQLVHGCIQTLVQNQNKNGEGPKHFKCPDCGDRFYSLAKMLKHDRKFHTGEKDYECRICGAEVTDISVHMKVRNPYFGVGPSKKQIKNTLKYAFKLFIHSLTSFGKFLAFKIDLELHGIIAQ